MTPEAKPKPGSAMVVLAFYVLVAACWWPRHFSAPPRWRLRQA